ncbi:syntaxin-112-like [Pyrus ussuriensis x Pyrus communis]|uniref:Syntaxin-112-like n=1 Tax=Pyrus ussuriensis x Pyrus communis TaxID=2448454 RepID=A0A5N5I758_9ROSA|nr:syntaxin-112 [Pyrus x bretschneideri]XP_048436041.1 syntaxin-112 [Pyrus x bretschneideri]XP_048436042.1 syntaxin-112 [Pyrus x bretschneideri]KAB2634606.1 syntaxin-112-like [Pyrus ussuriensis x Pyrus communis]KAB2635618.1 syntaxin-112-like [Pyrus ussuriensis x Pyrus communis]
MNDLMTKSFLSYVDLKKQAMKDLESQPDLEMGKLDAADEQNLAGFFEQVNAMKADMEEITNLLVDLQDLNEETKSTHSAKVLRGLRDRINADMVTILRKAKSIKASLESLDRCNVANRIVSAAYKEGSPVDRMRISVTNGLRIKLREIMNDFQILREQIVKEHKDGLKRRYFSATGEEASDEVIDKMISTNGQVKTFEGKAELVMENQERHEVLKDIQRSLTELHQVFLDMAVLVEKQGEQLDDIEQNVVGAGAYINDGTNALSNAKKMKKRRGKWVCWIGAVVLFILLVCLVSIFA